MPYWPGLYDPAIKVIKELGDPKLLPSQKLRIFMRAFGLALRAYQMTRIAFDESAYYQLKPKYGDNSYEEMDFANSDYEELPPETQILLLKHINFKDLIQLEFLTKPTVSARS